MNLTADNYFSKEADMEYMSNSQFKSFMRCQAAAMAELNGEYQRERSSAMLIGSYVDEAILWVAQRDLRDCLRCQGTYTPADQARPPAGSVGNG